MYIPFTPLAQAQAIQQKASERYRRHADRDVTRKTPMPPEITTQAVGEEGGIVEEPLLFPRPRSGRSIRYTA